ncbi:hypothetical protein [Phyllobacterium sp. YR531]|uniref:hypothetical protein n=1 Tax=Phyllobacterium sp. YR531 TaxID=1144343 RepID=UPI00026F4A20|nr:hypothetical protein [Phyllobacterium sp. YR531]EJM98691.1 hypothetical protein PMI41_04451 [Phyllobacterium sp. YR531]
MMNRFKLAAAAIALLALSGHAVYAASPAGKFCGEVISYGDYQDIQTNLSVDRDGKIVGSYKIDGPAGRTDGNIVEKDKKSPTDRTLIWTDKDGTGLVSLHFSDDYQDFKAAWGGSNNGRFDPPIHSWSGTRCPPTPTP